MTTTFNTTGFTDEQFRKLLDAGYTVQRIEKLWADIEYRREYNQRPERKEYHKKYNARRWAETKAMKAVIRDLKRS